MWISNEGVEVNLAIQCALKKCGFTIMESCLWLDFVLEKERAFLVANHDVGKFLIHDISGDHLRAHTRIIVNQVRHKIGLAIRVTHKLEPI
jgi:hypothetical protein